jgi:dipicolinate synthase subunit B
MMMRLLKVKVGFAFTGSFCTHNDVIPILEEIVREGAEVTPMVSDSVKNWDTRFGLAKDFLERIENITGKKVLSTIVEVEPIGPKSTLDIIVVAPCTGNTMSKLANGITDTSVTMAVKAHLRNQKPVLLSLATNDALGGSSKNIGLLLNSKNIYFVPFYQDDPIKKPNSMVASLELLKPALYNALEGRQIEPVMISR